MRLALLSLLACGTSVQLPSDASKDDSPAIDSGQDVFVQDTSILDSPIEAADPCAQTASCTSYCDAYVDRCAGDGTTCQALCPYLPSGLECRRMHACAKDCSQANVWSDACEAQCVTFCTIELAVCTGQDAQYLGMNECLSKCGTWAAGMPGDSSGNSLACREYHLGVTALAKPNRATHCPHTADVSSLCN